MLSANQQSYTEKLQRDLERTNQWVRQLQITLDAKEDEIQELKQQTKNTVSDKEVAALRQQLQALDNEKNALLDYIEENMEPDQASSQLDDLRQANAKLEEQVQALRAQLGNSGKQALTSPNFAPDLREMKPNELGGADDQDLESELPASIHSQAEDTFGRDHNQLRRHFEQTKQNHEAEVAKLRAELTQAKTTIESLKCKDAGGSLSHRSHLSNASGDHAQSLEFYKQKCRELEQRQKSAHENSRTLSATLNETQHELENLVNDHQQLAKECAQQVNQIEQLNHTLQTNQKLIEDLRNEK